MTSHRFLDASINGGGIAEDIPGLSADPSFAFCQIHRSIHDAAVALALKRRLRTVPILIPRHGRDGLVIKPLKLTENQNGSR